MIPEFNIDGLLPPGTHSATWQEVISRLGKGLHRKRLVEGLKRALENLRSAGCRVVYLDGSFVTAKEFPSDYDACYESAGLNPDRADPVFFDFRNQRAAQKTKYLGEFFPAHMVEGSSGRVFIDFFQVDKETGQAKGIISIDLQGGLI